MAFIGCFVVFQLLSPFRYICYPNELFWNEEGFALLACDADGKGYATFVRDAVTKRNRCK
jgi:hypothetical protein